jgi:hypothetical protein
MTAWSHMMNNHLNRFPRAYAKAAMQKHAEQHVVQLKTGLPSPAPTQASIMLLMLQNVLSTAWARWCEQAACDLRYQAKRLNSRIPLAA